MVSPGQEILAVSANNLQGTFYRVAAPFGWLATRQPIATAGYSIYLYDITGDSEAHARLSGLYQAYGLVTLAEKEKGTAAAYAGRPSR